MEIIYLDLSVSLSQWSSFLWRSFFMATLCFRISEFELLFPMPFVERVCWYWLDASKTKSNWLQNHAFLFIIYNKVFWCCIWSYVVTWRRIGTISFSSAIIRSRWRYYSGSTACIWILMCCSNWEIWFASMASRIKEALPWSTSRIQFLCTWKLRLCEWIGWSSSNQAFLIFSVLHGWWILFRSWIDDIRSCFFGTDRSSRGRFYLSKAWNWKEVLINQRQGQNRQSNSKWVIYRYI